MQAQSSGSSCGNRLEVEYTSKPVSGWGGLVAVARFLEKLGVRELLRRALPDGRTSPNQIPVIDIVLTFLTSVLLGARRFAHVERQRADEVVRTILGIARMPSAMTVTRYLGGFVRSQVEHMSEVVWSLVLARLPRSSLGGVLDLDSTVFERYGQQEGSLKGHNPRKHGRPSHHPILAMLAEAKVVVHAWLRSGNSGTARGVSAFLAETMARLGDYLVYAVRADSGYFQSAFLDDLEARNLPYSIAVRMSRHVKQAVIGIRDWQRFGPGLEAAAMDYQAPGWRAPRRIAVIREEIKERPDAKGRQLIEAPGYMFHAVVSSMGLSPIDTWHFYNGRADCENRLKELKDDFGANGFCMKSFDGTEAAFRLICFLFNLMADFKREVTRNERPQLGTLRTEVLVVGGVVGSTGRRKVLRLGLRGERRERFARLLARVDEMRSTVAQLPSPVGEPRPRKWQPRRWSSTRRKLGVLRAAPN